MFGNGVFWKTLSPLEEPIKDPTVGTQFHQPTSDDVPVVEKRNYSQTFGRSPFVGVSKVDKIDIFVGPIVLITGYEIISGGMQYFGVDFKS